MSNKYKQLKISAQGMNVTATSGAVFASFAALYFASAAARWSEVGWIAQATSITGAVATYLFMQQHQFGLVPSLGILGTMVVVWALASMPMHVTPQPSQPFYMHMPAHALVFSAAFVAGAAAYVASVVAMAVNMPVWAALVVTIAAAPLFLAYVLPHAAAHVEAVFVQQI